MVLVSPAASTVLANEEAVMPFVIVHMHHPGAYVASFFWGLGMDIVSKGFYIS